MDGAEPTDEQLIEFARSLLRDHASLSDREILEETIGEHRHIWALIYWISEREPPPPEPPSLNKTE